jgi:L-methionine (R)-S-oxide reductase
MVESKAVIKELQEMRDEGHLSDALLRRAVRKIKSSDDRYDWVGVYLLDTEKNELWLHNYMGQPTEHARIPVGTGVCGTAIEKKENQNVPDVTKVSNYLACNTSTKSELVVLIRAGDDIFGQIDIDSSKAAAFSKDDEGAVQAVADKIAEQLMAERR